MTDPRAYDDDAPCCCGHVRDEHDGECTVDGCDCILFEYDAACDDEADR